MIKQYERKFIVVTETRLRQIIEGVEDLGVWCDIISLDFAREFRDKIRWDAVGIHYFSKRPEFVKEFHRMWEEKGWVKNESYRSYQRKH